MREYDVDIHIHAVMKLDEAVFDNVDDDFRKHIYNLQSEREIITHLAWNLLQGAKLSILDGWANLKSSQAEFEIKDFEMLDFERTDEPS